MANIHTNIAVVSSTDKSVLEQAVRDISETFECYTDIETDGGQCELEFCTNGPFPLKMMEGITDKNSGKDLYIQVITYELPHEMVQHHIYENGLWTDKLVEKYQNKLNAVKL